MSRISRRSLLTSGAAAGVLAASGLALAAVPKTGGTLRAVLPGASIGDTWDARTHSELFMMAASHGAVFDCLTEIGPDGALRGELAQSWDASPDARVWTFDLRRDVTFHNGKAFGADDVLETFALHEADSGSPAAPLLAGVQDIRKLTDHQVQFELTAPNADFPYLLSDYHLVIYPAGYVELAMIGGIGTGLYRVASFEPGVAFRATRVDGHYKDGKAGFFDSLEFYAASSSEGLSLLQTGATDAVGQISASDAAQLADWTGVRLQKTTGNAHVALSVPMNGDDGLNLRQALQHGVDRRALLDDVLLGHGDIGRDTPVGPANQYFATKLDAPAFDPDLARHYLKASGVDRLDLALSQHLPTPASELGAAISNQIGALGLPVQLGKTSAGLHASAGRATEDWALSTYLTAGAPWNTSNWTHPMFEDLLLSARAELDSAKRRVVYEDIQRLLQTEGALTVPVFADHLQAVSDRVATPSAIGRHWAMDNARFAERWWRA
ncbi:MAG: ABC transporter substrate-binding protein [Shimia sp.]|uniref:ABC transporter substrate-binding protein n=1 Tax=Shimia sp. TaxID=1954381 RepID=UPI004059929D